MKLLPALTFAAVLLPAAGAWAEPACTVFKPASRLRERDREAATAVPDLLLIWIGVTAGPWVLIGLLAYGLLSVL